MKSYLNNRNQTVKINYTVNNKQLIKIGISQGTVLGPILCILYLNSLLHLNVNGLVISFADDSALVFKGYTLEETKNMAELALGIIKE